MKTQNSFEYFINKDIQEVSTFFDCKLQSNLLNKNLYDINLKEKRTFYNFTYQFVTIITDEKDKLTSFSIKFQNTIDGVFYNFFVIDYGKPNKTLIEKGRKLFSESKSKIDESNTFHQELKQYTSILEEANFDDNPKYIFWDKESYQIKISIFYEWNSSEITFSKIKTA
jgi:hypothetical protein